MLDVYVNSDKDNINAALDLVADILLHPSFDKNEFDKMLLDMKGEYEANKSDPQYIAFNVVSKKTTLYPKGHPLYPESIDENLDDLQHASLDDIKNFYASFYGADNGSVSFVGNIDNAYSNAYLENNFSNFHK